MAIRHSIQRPVEPRADEARLDNDSASDYSEEEDIDQDDQSTASFSEDKSAPEESQSESETEAQDEPSLANISFGALAKAQESLVRKSRKRKYPGDSETVADKTTTKNENDNTFPHSRPTSKPNPSNTTRTSKHAPTILSSKHEVSRKREIFSPPAVLKSRDPRFDPTILTSSTSSTLHVNRAVAQDKANKNYSFLSDYQASEVLSLKSRIKSSKDPDMISRLKRELMSIESKLKNAEQQRREKEILRRHNTAEKEKIRTGQKSKPYYLKESEVKKLANEERLEGMGKRAREKALERKRKREKSKEARFMPKIRRER